MAGGRMAQIKAGKGIDGSLSEGIGKLRALITRANGSDGAAAGSNRGTTVRAAGGSST